MTLLPRLVLLFTLAAAPFCHAETKVFLCTGDYGMWGQDRVPMITHAVEKAAPGAFSWESEQSYNFVKKLEAPGFAERFDVIACGDIGIGQFTVAAQQALVRFVEHGGGLVYVAEAKSLVPFKASREVLPAPLADVLPYKYPDANPTTGLREDAVAYKLDAPLFAGLDFSTTPFGKMPDGKPQPPEAIWPLAVERAQGAGRVIALYGGFRASYVKKGYAQWDHLPGGWDEWPQLGALWVKVLARAAERSPVLTQTRAQLEAALQQAPLAVAVEVDATKVIDEIRAANFSIVALRQLYTEDGGQNEALFLELNPRDWFDRLTNLLLPDTHGTKADKPALLREYNIKGIYMAANSYGSYGAWDDKKYEEQIAEAIATTKKYPGLLAFFQPGNEPPLNPGYFAFHNRISQGVLAGAPEMRVIGPNKPFNLEGVDDQGMRDFIEACGKTTDVLNWHTYAQPPASTLTEALYWSRFAAGKMRSPGPASVMFTESDTWNTRDSQFNYLMDRAFTFLPEKTIIGTFQYCMDRRHEGGPYQFGVLQPEGEFSGNYNAYWVWRNLRGQMTSTTVATPGEAAADARGHLHAISSLSADGLTATTVLYYDSGWFAGNRRAPEAKVSLKVKLPPGSYTLTRSDVAWNVRKATETPGTVEGGASVEATLRPYQAAAFTWVRK